MSWQLLTFLSVIALSFSIVLQRVLLHTYKSDPYAYVIVFQGVVGVVMVAAAMVVGFSLEGLDKVFWPALISIILCGLGHITYAKTLQRVEASTFSVLFATQAVWTMALGILLLGETMTALQVFGSLLIFVSVAMVSKRLKGLRFDKGTALGLITGVLFGVAIYYWSLAGRYMDGLTWGGVSFLATALFVALIRPSALPKTRTFLKTKALIGMTVMALTYGAGTLAMLYAYRVGTFALVSPLRQTSIIITVFFALWLLKGERRNIPRKVAAACTCLAGVALIVL